MSHVPNRRLLVIDDNESIHEDFRKILRGASPARQELAQAAAALFGDPTDTAPAALEFEIDSALNGRDGLERVRQAKAEKRPYFMAFVDIRMPPGWDGIETVEHLWKVDKSLQVVFCTAYTDHSWEDMTSRLGCTDRFLILKKPFDNIEVRQLCAALMQKWHLERESRRRFDQLEAAVAARTREIAATRDVAVFALAQLAESRDPETGAHLERMRSYAQLLAEQLAVEGPYTDVVDEAFLHDLFRSSPLHDIGKVGIPDAILLKPGCLNASEFDFLKRHTIIGAEALQRAAQHSGCGGFLAMAADVALFHHERFDGSGYPMGLAGQQIPLPARIVALADVFDALTSVRVYKAAYDPSVARAMIESESGKHFDPAIVAAFQARYDDFLHVLQGEPAEEAAELAAV